MRWLAGAWILAVLMALAVAGALVPLGDIHAIDLDNRHATMGAVHWLGTDHLGRDMFSRLAAGGWRAILATLLAAGLAVGAGLALGLAAVSAPAWIRLPLLRVIDLAALVPEFVIAIVVVAILGFSPWSVAIGIGIGGAGTYGLMTHGLAAAVLRRPFVFAARALGASRIAIARRHVLPAVIRPVRTYLASHAGQIVVQYAALAFLGFGTDSGTPDWGAMLFEYRFFLLDDPALVIWPALAIALFVLALHLLLEPVEAGVPRPEPVLHQPIIVPKVPAE